MARERSDIPPDWITTLLDQVTQRGSGHTPDKTKAQYWNGGIKWVSLADSSKLDRGSINETDKEISAEGLAHSSAVLHPQGTVILSRDAGVGKSAVLGDDMAVSQHFISWRCDGPGQLHNWFLYYWLQLYKKEFERQAVGSTIKTIGLPYFKKLRISFPKYPEQVRIAEIIGTWDCAIDTVGKLIDNSEHLHRALVKRLFTSAQKTRNAKEYLVGDLGIIFTGLSGKRGDDFGRGNPYVPYSNVFKNSRFDPGKVDYVLLAPGERQNQVRYGDTLVTTSSETPDEVGMTSVVLDEVKELYLNSFCFGFRPNDFAVILPEYGRYLFRSPEFRRLIIPLAQGSTRYNLAKSEFLKLRVVLPPVDEQAKIAVILSESESLSTKLRDYVRTLTIERSALMQQLLTGKCRVQLDEAKGKAAVA